jgi:hypothetical protein
MSCQHGLGYWRPSLERPSFEAHDREYRAARAYQMVLHNGSTGMFHGLSRACGWLKGGTLPSLVLTSAHVPPPSLLFFFPEGALQVAIGLFPAGSQGVR